MSDDIDEIIDDGFRAIDWSVLELPEVLSVCEHVAGQVAGAAPGVLEADDVYQDATILLAKNHGIARGLLAEENGPSQLHRWLFNRLRNRARTQVRHAERMVPLAPIVERQLAREGAA